jgi:polysaccharide export outer membrane protein
MKQIVWATVCLSVTLLACAEDTKVGAGKSTQQVGPQTTLFAAQPGAPPVAAAPDTYIIGAQDVVQVTVWKEPELSGPIPVRPDGKISLALLNDVDAAGLTPTQLAESIASKLKKYMEEPRVSVIVTQINSRRVYVLGQVMHPGAMPLTPDMTVLQAISTAGGLSQFTDGKKAYVLRSENGVQRRIPVNYKLLVKGEQMDANVLLKSGDTIVVP